MVVDRGRVKLWQHSRGGGRTPWQASQGDCGAPCALSPSKAGLVFGDGLLHRDVRANASDDAHRVQRLDIFGLPWGYGWNLDLQTYLFRS